MARRGTARALRHLALVAVALVACDGHEPGPGLDMDRVIDHVHALTKIGPRPQDSDGSRTAAGYIEDELDRLGVAVTRSPVGSVEIPEIRVLGAVRRHAQRIDTTDPNLLARFGPPGDALLVMAHYDTVAGSPGAADNAAAVALLLELARVLHEVAPPQPVLLAFTANEEIGLVGAEALAAQRSDIRFAIALDLLGGDGPLVINGASTLIGQSELAWLADAAGRAGVEITAPPAHRVVSRWWPQAERSDHGPFTRHGVRAVHFYNRGNDGEWIDLAYHSERDVPERLHRESLAATGRLLRALVDVAPPPHDGDGYWVPLAHVVVPRWALIACELVLLLVVIVALVLARDGLVERLASRDRRVEAPRGAGLVIAALCYVLAIAAACIVERMTSRGHPAPWLHAPLRALVGDVLVIGGVLGLASRGVARQWPWLGVQRYRVLAAITCAVVGVAWLVVGAAELAWIWLVPAVVIAIAPPRVAIIALVASALPIACVLSPPQLREAAWNGFLPVSLPLSLLVGIVGAPTFATAAWWLRTRPRSGPLGTLVLGMGCGLAVVVGLVFAVTFEPACSSVKFERFHLACERV